MSGNRWAALSIAAGAQAAGAALFFGLPALAPALRSTYGLTLAETGVLLSSVFVGMALTLLAWGITADRFGERRVIVIGLTGTAGAISGAALMDSFVPLLGFVLAAGMFVASTNVASGRATIGWFPAERRGVAMGLRQASIPIGAAVAAATLPPIAVAHGARASLMVLALIVAAAAPVVALWLRDPPGQSLLSSWSAVRGTLRQKRVWRMAGANSLLVCTQFAFIVFLALFLHDHRGYSVSESAVGVTLLHVGAALSRVVMGYWSDRTGSRIQVIGSIGAVITIGLPGLALLIDAPAALMLPVLALTALAAVSWNGVAYVAISELAGVANSGTAIGLQNSLFVIVGATFIPIFATSLEATSWGLSFGALSVFPLTAMMLLWGMDRTTSLEQT